MITWIKMIHIWHEKHQWPQDMTPSDTVKSSWPVPKELKVAVLAIKVMEMEVPATSQASLAVPTFLTSTNSQVNSVYSLSIWLMFSHQMCEKPEGIPNQTMILKHWGELWEFHWQNSGTPPALWECCPTPLRCHRVHRPPPIAGPNSHSRFHQPEVGIFACTCRRYQMLLQDDTTTSRRNMVYSVYICVLHLFIHLCDFYTPLNPRGRGTMCQNRTLYKWTPCKKMSYKVHLWYSLTVIYYIYIYTVINYELSCISESSLKNV